MQTNRGTHDIAFLTAAIARCNKLLVRKLPLSAQIKLIEDLQVLHAQILAA